MLGDGASIVTQEPGYLILIDPGQLDLLRFERLVSEAGYKPMSWPFHGRGLGDDLPVMANASAASDAVFEEGHVLILKPGLVPTDIATNEFLDPALSLPAAK